MTVANTLYWNINF